jgi:hypothetical protein
MTALPLSVESALRSRLDFTDCWPANGKCLLAPRASGWHPLLQANCYLGIDGGDLTSTTRRARQLKARQREYVVNKALACSPRGDTNSARNAKRRAVRAARLRASGMRPSCPFEPKGGRGSGRHEG